MTTPRPHWFAALVVLALVSPLRADYLPTWSYSWTTTTPTLSSSTGSGSVTLMPNSATTTVSTTWTGLVAANISTTSPVGSADSLNATSGAYTLSLTITDAQAATAGVIPSSHTFVFTGNLTGTFSAGSALLNNTFTSAGPLTFDLGNSAYTASLAGYVPPGPPGSTTLGRHRGRGDRRGTERGRQSWPQQHWLAGADVAAAVQPGHGRLRFRRLASAADGRSRVTPNR